jgi:CheY-like chemotaxis protein
MPSDDFRLAAINVLLVDDNEDARTILGRYLEHHGAVVTLAANAAEALGKIREVRPHIIVTDLSMPGLDGIEFVTRARAVSDARQPPVPAIVVTAFHDTGHERRAHAAGFHAYLRKPVDPLVVVDAILAALRRGPSAEA